MASTLSDFNRTYRSLRYSIWLDVDNTNNYVDYTNNLDSFTWYEAINTGLPFGIVEVTAEAMLKLNKYEPALQKNGIKVKMVLSVSSDNWASQVDQTVFWGTTNDKTIVTDRNIKLVCVGATTTKLKQKDVFGSGTSVTARDISILIAGEVGGVANIGNFQLSGHIIDNVFQIGDNTYSQNIDLYCSASNYLIRQRLTSEQTIDGISALGSLATIDDNTIATYTLDRIIKYNNTGSRAYNYNRIKNKSYIRKYVINQQLYSNKNLSGIEIKANSTLYYVVDDKDLIDYFSIEPFQAFSGGETVSYYQCATADDGTGLSNAGITLSSGGIINQNGQTKVLLKLNNTNGSSRWLKYVGVYGFAGFIVNDIIENDDRDVSQIGIDGKEYLLEYNSRFIQSNAQAVQLSNELLANYNSMKKIYSFVCKGNPTVQVGDVVKFQTRDLAYHYGKVMELDSEISRDRGYEQTILVKEV